MPVKITIRRQGQFVVPNLTFTNQCGREGQREFNFSCRITVNRLDDQGFVCDNFKVVPALQDKFGTGRWLASCEQLAGAGVWLMRELCGGRATRIEFEVSPIAEAGVTVEWNKGDAMPDFFPTQLDRKTTRRPTRQPQRKRTGHQWERMSREEVVEAAPF